MKKEDAKVDGERLSQEEIDKDIVKLKEQVDALRRILEGSQRLGWVLRKNPMEWHEIQRRLQQKKVKWLREKLKEVELEMEDSICELELGEILGECEDYTEDKEWRPSEDLMEYWDNSKQHEEMLTKDEDLKTKNSSEAKESHGFKYDNLCMFAGETFKEGQFANIVIMEEEDIQNLNFVLEEYEIDRSHIQLTKDIKQPSEGLE